MLSFVFPSCRKKIFCALFGALISLPAQAEPTSWKMVGDWDISFYPGANGCAAYTSYDGGASFFIGLSNYNGKLFLEFTIAHGDWTSIEDKKEYAVAVAFGDEAPWKLQMSGAEYGSFWGLNFSFEAASEQAGLFVNEFMRETNMAWYYNGKFVGNFSLRNSRRALEEAVACTKSFRDATGASSDPFAPTDGAKTNDPFAN